MMDLYQKIDKLDFKIDTILDKLHKLEIQVALNKLKISLWAALISAVTSSIVVFAIHNIKLTG